LSGELGPKLREGDRQVPEGVYRITYLNPNSISHLSLALGYPNPFDRLHAEEDGRESAILGGDIMIHGGARSVGCLAIGDQAAEDLFVLAADSDWEQAVVVVSPVDFRRAALPADHRPDPEWVNRLYGWLRTELETLPLPPPAPFASAGEAADASSERHSQGVPPPSLPRDGYSLPPAGRSRAGASVAR
jgi:L,D-transpeptidase catalytic domain